MRYITVLVAVFIVITTANAQQVTEEVYKTWAKNTIDFLGRTQITGNEAEAMLQARALMQAITTGQAKIVVVTKEREEQIRKDKQ